ncbi:MAG: hypothetical protein AVDCRST_MAG08-79, partial [uncultured Acetobacteraceae bacterium]
ARARPDRGRPSGRIGGDVPLDERSDPAPHHPRLPGRAGGPGRDGGALGHLRVARFAPSAIAARGAPPGRGAARAAGLLRRGRSAHPVHALRHGGPRRRGGRRNGSGAL